MCTSLPVMIGGRYPYTYSGGRFPQGLTAERVSPAGGLRLTEVAGQQQGVGAGVVQAGPVSDGDEDRLDAVLGAQRPAHLLLAVEQRRPVTPAGARLLVREGERVLGDADRRRVR